MPRWLHEKAKDSCGGRRAGAARRQGRSLSFSAIEDALSGAPVRSSALMTCTCSSRVDSRTHVYCMADSDATSTSMIASCDHSPESVAMFALRVLGSVTLEVQLDMWAAVMMIVLSLQGTSALHKTCRTEPLATVERVHVVVRIRPLTTDSPRGNAWSVSPSGRTVALVEGACPVSGRLRTASSAVFTFDRVFDESSSTRDIYKTTIRPVVWTSLAGVNGTVFAYGQTGSGKTHTLIGNTGPSTRSSLGIVPMALIDVLDQIQQRSQTEHIAATVTLTELHNETFLDLLASPSPNRRLPVLDIVVRCFCSVLSRSTHTWRPCELKLSSLNTRSCVDLSIDLSIRTYKITPATADSVQHACRRTRQTEPHAWRDPNTSP
jgi:Kinesin motor domain